MKKWMYRFVTVVMILIIVLLTVGCSQNEGSHRFAEQKQAKISKIPEQAIRLRVIANSDSERDQLLKQTIRDSLINYISDWEKMPHSLAEAREMLAVKLPQIKNIIDKQFNSFGISDGYKIKLGRTSFPAKWYAGTVYPAGIYEALVVTIGAGKGKNWWCVLFPPLCFIDATSAEPTTPKPLQSNGTETEIPKVENPEVETKFWIWEKILSWFR